MKNRVMEGGANRNPSEGKLHPYGFINPLNDFSFCRYMDKHRVLEDGTLRAPDNWQNGGKEWQAEAFKSLVRHVEDLKLMQRGYAVYKEKTVKKGEITHVFTTKPEDIPSWWHEVDIEECCNAIRFGVEAFKLVHLTSSPEYDPKFLLWSEEDKGVFEPSVVQQLEVATLEFNSKGKKSMWKRIQAKIND